MFKFNLEKKPIISMVFFAIVAIASIADIIMDISHGARLGHIIQESFIVIFSLIFFFMLYSDSNEQKITNRNLLQELQEIRELSAKSSQQQIKARQDFAILINQQFSSWSLTKSESDVALFLLKGFNSKEISTLRGTSEKTIRNQLSSIYQKAGVSGKHALIAWFIDDLLQPPESN